MNGIPCMKQCRKGKAHSSILRITNTSVRDSELFMKYRFNGRESGSISNDGVLLIIMIW